MRRKLIFFLNTIKCLPTTRYVGESLSQLAVVYITDSFEIACVFSVIAKTEADTERRSKVARNVFWYVANEHKNCEKCRTNIKTEENQNVKKL